MADLPIINNLRDKLIPNRNNDEDDIFESENTGESPEQDVLEQYRIALNTELEEEILTPSKLSKVKFTVTQPKGFSFKQVEVFHTEVSRSVQWYIQALEKRDRDVHKLATEIDKYKTDVQNARFQLEVLQGVGGQAVVDSSGEYVTESQMSDQELRIIELEQQVAELNNDLKYERRVNLDLKKELETKPAPAPAPAPVAFPPLSTDAPSHAELIELAELRERQVELDQWEAQVVAEYERIEGELETTKALLASKEQELASLQDELDAATHDLRNALSASESADDASEANAQLIADLQAQLAVANGRVKEIVEEREGLIAERDAANDELSNLRNVVPAGEGDEELSSALEAAQNEIDTLTNKVEGLEKHITDLDEYIDGVDKTIEAHNEALIEQTRLAEELAEALAEKDRVIAEKDRLLAERPAAGGYAGGERIPGYRLPEGITAEDLGLE